MEFTTLFNQFKQLKVLVVGDVMLDNYLYGNVERISPEAPVPVVNVTHVERHPGGASNVALNVAAMGATAFIAGVVGDDSEAQMLREALSLNKINVHGVIVDSGRQTTVKNRVVSRNHQMLRYDFETLKDIDGILEEELLGRVKELLDKENIDVVVFEDYNKGVLTPIVIEQVMALCAQRFVPTCVDPKSKNFMAYKDATLFKPNLREIREALKIDIDVNDIQSLQKASNLLREHLHHHITLITLSEHGIYCDEGKAHYLIPAHMRNIADVSGAGDSVIAVAALCLALNLDARLLAAISNIAGGLVCEVPGVAAIDREQLLAEANRLIR